MSDPGYAKLNDYSCPPENVLSSDPVRASHYILITF